MIQIKSGVHIESTYSKGKMYSKMRVGMTIKTTPPSTTTIPPTKATAVYRNSATLTKFDMQHHSIRGLINIHTNNSLFSVYFLYISSNSTCFGTLSMKLV